MNPVLTIIPDTRIALFRWSGPITFEDRMKNVERMALFCSENNINHLLVDLSKQESNTGIMKMFELGASVPKLLGGIKIAVVCQPTDTSSEFGETVAANRGANSRLFATIDDAQRWLEEKGIASNNKPAANGT